MNQSEFKQLRRSINGHQRHVLRLLETGESPTLMLNLDGRTVAALFRKRLLKHGFMRTRRLTRLGQAVVYNER